MRSWILLLVACTRTTPQPERPPTVEPAIPADAAAVDAASPEVAIAEAPVAATCERFDPRDPACRADCRHADCKCPSPPDVDNPSCWAVMPCPNPPDRRVRACFPKFPSCPDPGNLHCPPTSTIARVIKVDSSDSSRFITIAAGQHEGVSMQWKGALLRGDSDEPLPGGEVTLIRVTPRHWSPIATGGFPARLG